MTSKSELHSLIDELPAHEVEAAYAYLHALCGHVEETPTVVVVDDPGRPDPPDSASQEVAWKEFEHDVKAHAEHLHEDLEEA